MKAEILNVPMDDYVRDKFEGPPSLSSSIAHKILTRSPLHGWWAHARLNPAWVPDEDRRFDIGTAAHGVLLEGRVVVPLPFKDFRTKAAQEARDAAKLAGGLPVLEEDGVAIVCMVENVRRKISECPDLVGLGELVPERTVRWRDGDACCRARPDWTTYDHAIVASFKTTKATAEPESFRRTIIGSGYDTQAGFELAGIKAATGVDAKYFWIVAEVEPPYAVSLLGLAPMFFDLARRKYARAVNEWSYCLAAGVWPAYSERVAWIDPPEWAVSQWAEQAMAAQSGDGSVDEL